MKKELKRIIDDVNAYMRSPEGQGLRINWCFLNSKRLSLAIPGLCYEEGMVLIDGLDFPLHHAWNSYKSHSIDMTAKIAGFKILSFRCFKRFTHAQLKRKAESKLFHYGNEWQEASFWFDENCQPVGDENLRRMRESVCHQLPMYENVDPELS